MFIFYKFYFEGEEGIAEFPLRGRELGENERVMSSAVVAVEEVLVAAEGAAVMVVRDTNGSRRRNSWILIPPRDREADLGGFDGRWLAGGWRLEG